MRCAKVLHKDKTSALIAAKRINNAGLGAYRCKQCKGWHLGNYKSNATDRIIQLLAQAARRNQRAARADGGGR